MHILRLDKKEDRKKQRYDTEIFLNEYSFRGKPNYILKTNCTLLSINDAELIDSCFDPNKWMNKYDELQVQEEEMMKNTRGKLRSILNRRQTQEPKIKRKKYEGLFGKCKTSENSLEMSYGRRKSRPSKIMLQPLIKSTDTFNSSKKKKNQMSKNFKYTRYKNSFLPKYSKRSLEMFLQQKKKSQKKIQIRCPSKNKGKEDSFRETQRTNKGPSPWQIVDQTEEVDFY